LSCFITGLSEKSAYSKWGDPVEDIICCGHLVGVSSLHELGVDFLLGPLYTRW
jgi:hypothetical protein